jgi:Relaxase/Mobilisation nuclease domain
MTIGTRSRDLSDAEWAEVAQEAMSRLGFEGSRHQAGCRWVAVRHGRSGAGNDHIHVVVGLVREDGKRARTANDFRQLSRLCADMEGRYGLSAVEGRAKKAAVPGLTRAEIEKARRIGLDETERADLGRVVRSAATVADSEAEFVRLLRDAGLAARPRFDRAGRHRVVGYAVAEEPSDGGAAVFFGGGKLATDLSLPGLRERWRTGEAESQDAATEWAGGAPATGVHEVPRANRLRTYRWAEASQCWGKAAFGEEHRAPTQRALARWREATEGLGEVTRTLGAVPAEDVSTWRAVASDAAGGLAVLSGRLERVPGPLAHASGLLARSAQGLRQKPARARCVPRGTIKSVAALMAQADLDEGTPAGWRLLLTEMLRVAQAVHDAHLARSESQQAGRLADEARKALEMARARLGSLEAVRAELLAVVEPAQDEVGRGQEKAARSRARRAGKRALRPEEFARTTTRRAPPQRSSEVAK